MKIPAISNHRYVKGHDRQIKTLQKKANLLSDQNLIWKYANLPIGPELIWF